MSCSPIPGGVKDSASGRLWDGQWWSSLGGCWVGFGRGEKGGDFNPSIPILLGIHSAFDRLYQAGSTPRVGSSLLRTLDNKNPSCLTNALVSLSILKPLLRDGHECRLLQDCQGSSGVLVGSQRCMWCEQFKLCFPSCRATFISFKQVVLFQPVESSMCSKLLAKQASSSCTPPVSVTLTIQ